MKTPWPLEDEIARGALDGKSLSPELARVLTDPTAAKLFLQPYRLLALQAAGEPRPSLEAVTIRLQFAWQHALAAVRAGDQTRALLHLKSVVALRGRLGTTHTAGRKGATRRRRYREALRAAVTSVLIKNGDNSDGAVELRCFERYTAGNPFVGYTGYEVHVDTDGVFVVRHVDEARPVHFKGRTLENVLYEARREAGLARSRRLS